MPKAPGYQGPVVSDPGPLTEGEKLAKSAKPSPIGLRKGPAPAMEARPGSTSKSGTQDPVASYPAGRVARQPRRPGS